MTADICEYELKIAISRLKLKLNWSHRDQRVTRQWYKQFKNELILVMLPTLNWVLIKAQTHQAGRRQ